MNFIGKLDNKKEGVFTPLTITVIPSYSFLGCASLDVFVYSVFKVQLRISRSWLNRGSFGFRLFFSHMATLPMSDSKTLAGLR